MDEKTNGVTKCRQTSKLSDQKWINESLVTNYRFRTKFSGKISILKYEGSNNHVFLWQIGDHEIKS